MRIKRPYLFRKCEAVKLGHHDVKKAELKFVFSVDMHSLCTVSDKCCIVLSCNKVILQQLPEIGIVLCQ